MNHYSLHIIRRENTMHVSESLRPPIVIILRASFALVAFVSAGEGNCITVFHLYRWKIIYIALYGTDNILKLICGSILFTRRPWST